MQKWEYRLEGFMTILDLNAAGERGWELIAVTKDISKIDVRNVLYEFYFKRPISNESKGFPTSHDLGRGRETFRDPPTGWMTNDHSRAVSSTNFHSMLQTPTPMFGGTIPAPDEPAPMKEELSRSEKDGF